MSTPLTTILRSLLRGQRGLLLRFAATSLGRTAMVMGTVLLIREFLFAVLQQHQGLAGAVAQRAGSEVALGLEAYERLARTSPPASSITTIRSFGSAS